jgi:hypothetical protein
MPPDPMTGFSPRPVEILIVALCVVCTWRGVNNLLNHTLPVAGTSDSTKQVWGLLEQDSIYGQTQEVLLIITSKLLMYHVTPPCHIWPVPTGTSKAGVHSWFLTIQWNACKRNIHDHACTTYQYANLIQIQHRHI